MMTIIGMMSIFPPRSSFQESLQVRVAVKKMPSEIATDYFSKQAQSCAE